MTSRPMVMEDEVRDTLRFHLQSIDPQLAMLRQAVYSGRCNLEFMFGDVPFLLHFSDLDERPIVPVLALQLRAGKASGWLFLESFDIAGDEWAGIFSSLDAQLAQALIAEEAASLFGRLAQTTGSMLQLLQVQVHAVRPLGAITQMLKIENRKTGVTVNAALCADSPDMFEWAASALAMQTPRPVAPPVAACLPVRIQIGVVWMRANQLNKPQCGDILILPTVGGMHKLKATCLDHRGRRLPLRALLNGSTGNLTLHEGMTMRQDPNDMRFSREAPVPLDDVQVPVTIVIGEVELPLRAFGNIQAGYVFELPTSVEDAIVRLYTGSACVGQGRLVTVGNRIGVRLLEWGGKSDGESA